MAEGRARGLAGATEILNYRQDSMPWAYWLAFVLVGVVGLLVVAVVLVGLIRGTSGVGPRGGVFWGGLMLIYATVWVYGRRRAYEHLLAGNDLEWRAPLRRRRFPLSAVVSAEVRRAGGWLGERQASLILATGEELLIVVPNARHERRFAAFCDAVKTRVPSFVGPIGATSGPGCRVGR